MRSKLARGALLMSGVSVFSRLASLVAQLVLGRVLLEEEFGLFAMALGFTEIAASLRSVLQPVLVERLENDEPGFRQTYRTTMVSICSLAIIGVAVAPTISSALGEPDLRWLLVAMFLTMPLQVLPGFAIAKLNHGFEFGTSGRVLALATLVRYGVLMTSAIAGLGAYSFVCGIVGAMVAECVMLRKQLAGLPPLLTGETIEAVRRAVRPLRRIGTDRRWIWPSALALSLSTSGDYLGASLSSSLSRTTIGLYFFAYTLTGSLHQPVTLAANTVLVPGFVAAKTDEARRARLLEVLDVAPVAGVLLFNTAAVFIATMIDLLWMGKWNAAIPAALGFLLLAPLQALHPIALAIARGANFWNLYFSAIVANGLMVPVAGAVGASRGSLTELVAAVTIGYTLVTLSTLLRLGRRLEISPRTVLSAVLVPWMLGLPGLGVANAIHGLDEPGFSGALLAIAAYGVLTVALVVLPKRKKLQRLTRALRG